MLKLNSVLQLRPRKMTKMSSWCLCVLFIWSSEEIHKTLADSTIVTSLSPHYSKCHGLTNSGSNSVCLPFHQAINCINGSCTVNHTVKVGALNQGTFDFEHNITNSTGTKQVELLCSDESFFPSIISVTYMLPRLWTEYCPDVFLLESSKGGCDDIPQYSCLTQECSSSLPASRDYCNQTMDLSDISKLQDSCLELNGSCKLEIPMKIVEGYGKCVTGYNAICEYEYNYCYAHWVNVLYSCSKSKGHAKLEPASLLAVIIGACLSIAVFILLVVILLLVLRHIRMSSRSAAARRAAAYPQVCAYHQQTLQY